MGKSIRSKIKRKHRSEFRRTIGEDAAQATMATVQAKLQECVARGSMNSFERLSAILETTDVVNATSTGGGSPNGVPAIDAMDTSTITGAVIESGTKSSNKIPAKKRSRMKKQVIPNYVGSTGATLARKEVTKMKRRGQLKKGIKANRKSKSVILPRKKKNMCAF